MASADDMKAAVLGIIDQIQSADGAAVALSDTWSQAAASFASLTQGSNNPLVPQIQGFLGAQGTAASELLGNGTQAEGMLRDYAASL
jgi:pantothenate kinase-related protein Tda10